ncbi:MAG: hypothetical protein OXG98_02245 [Gemmatimonadetes bacterium]|nr:hypothetical protein [Gemmatimonadota bacterium]
MPTSSSSTNMRRYLYIAVLVLIALNCVFLWRDYQKEQGLHILQQTLYNAQVEIRVLKSEKIFGAPFVPQFRTVDLQGQPALLPNFGKDYLLLLFFKPSHCASCLDMMSSFESVIGDDVPVIGVAQAGSAEEIMPVLDEYEYKFPVYLAVDSPFDLAFSPYSVLIDGGKNVVRLSPIDTDVHSVNGLISEVVQFLEGR